MNKVIYEDLEKVTNGIAEKIDMSRRVLVTGGTGFIGGWLVRTLCTIGVKTALTTRSMHKTAGLSLDFRFNTYRDLEHAMSDFAPALIIHAASPGDPKEYLEDPVGCLQCNVGETGMIMEYAKVHGAQVMFISSGEVYGQSPTIPTGEWDFGPIPAGERSVYAVAKRAGEAACLAYHRQHGVGTYIARLHHTYGPAMRKDDGRVVPTFVQSTLAGQPLQLFGNGNQVRTFCYITDAVSGLLAILMKSDEGEVYNVGSPVAASIAELAAMFGGKVEKVKEAAYSPNTTIVPSTRRLEALGWKAEVSLKDGVQRTLESYR